jgi:hypothetical protein
MYFEWWKSGTLVHYIVIGSEAMHVNDEVDLQVSQNTNNNYTYYIVNILWLDLVNQAGYQWIYGFNFASPISAPYAIYAVENQAGESWPYFDYIQFRGNNIVPTAGLEGDIVAAGGYAQTYSLVSLWNNATFTKSKYATLQCGAGSQQGANPFLVYSPADFAGQLIPPNVVLPSNVYRIEWQTSCP